METMNAQRDHPSLYPLPDRQLSDPLMQALQSAGGFVGKHVLPRMPPPQHRATTAKILEGQRQRKIGERLGQ